MQAILIPLISNKNEGMISWEHKSENAKIKLQKSLVKMWPWFLVT